MKEFFDIFPEGIVYGGLYLLIFIVSIVVLWAIVKAIKHHLNYYPSKTSEQNISKMKNVSDDDLVDMFIVDNGTEEIYAHIEQIKEWKAQKIANFKNNERKINKFKFRCCENCYKAFKFIGFRTQTRYRQVNYQKYGYQVRVISNTKFLNEDEIIERIEFLKKHDYNITFNNYNKQDQRKALTKKLKEQIKERDNYICQNCGKPMPDEVGLHIDHIIPISRGGKSIPSNLRILCSKCNGKKGGEVLKK